MLNRKTLITSFLVLLAFLGGVLVAKRPWNGSAPTSPDPSSAPAAMDAPQERKVLYWVDPMHPQYRSDKPGTAPDCGMDLVPVYEEDASAQEEEHPEGTIRIPTGKQQLIGVRYGVVARMPLKKTQRAVARLAYDETRIARIHPKFDGWIEKVHVDFTGKLVRKGQPLVDIYSPALVSTQQEFLLAARARDTLGGNPFPEISAGAHSLYESSRRRLLLWDIDEKTIEQIEKTGQPQKALTLYSPIGGFVLERNAYERQRLTPETELYAVADLSNLWAMADIYEYEMPLIKLRQAATLDLAYFPGKTFRGTVDYIYPEVEPTTRTLKVRIQVPNPGYALKPDMYANVTFQIDFGEQTAVPVEAVLNSGAEQVAFVAHENGFFEPRRIKIGAEVDDYYVVLEGLEPGERVVTSANFLIDSESRLKAALGAMAGMGHGPAGEKPPKEKAEKAEKAPKHVH